MRLSKTAMRLAAALAIATLLFGTACVSTSSMDSPTPRRNTGCKGYAGAAYAACVEKSIAIWQERENAKGKSTKLKDDKNGSTRMRKTRVCWSDFCRDFYREWHEPGMDTYFYVAVGAFVVGAGLGAAAANAIVKAVVFVAKAAVVLL